MTRIQRPSDERANSDLLCWEQPGTPIDESASCPLLKTVHLLPIRYGRVEVAPEDTDPGYPYSLTSRPLGYRLLRNGYLYVLDANAGELHEYLHEDGELTGHNDGRLEYPKQHTLYVCFTDAPLTNRKKAQVLDNHEERAHFMQEINLASASAVSGGKYLLTPEQSKKWVAEFAEEFTPDAPEDGHPQESEPYHWENQPYYHKTRFGKLIKQQAIDDVSNCLCLVVRDDIGVMLDLAQHQDDVVGWLDEWARSGEEEGHTERDYMLASIIMSMTAVSDEVLKDTALATGDKNLDALLEDTSGDERQAIYRYLEVRKDYRGPEPMGTEAYLREHHGDNPLVNAQLEMVDTLGPARYETYRDTINQLSLQNFYRLNGAKLGQRGINDLIDRSRMTAFLESQQQKLARWHGLLDSITEDRATLICDSRFHRAAWYFDSRDLEQIEAAFTLEYLCMKDACRSDTAADSLLAWMQSNPYYTRPLFHTLSKSEQAPDQEPMATYATIFDKGYALVKNSMSWAQKLKSAEYGRLPDVEALSKDIQMKAAAVGDALSPAVATGMAKALQPLYEAIDSRSLPPLETLFRDLPFFFKGQMLDAINAGEAEFKVASAQELATFQENLRRLMALSERLTDISNQHEIVKSQQGHRSADARRLVDEFKATREEHRVLGDRVAAALSPVEEVDAGLRLEPAVTGRAGLTLVLPAVQQQALGEIMSSSRAMRLPNIRANLIGDGLGVLVAVVQACNFYSVVSRIFSDSPKRQPSIGVFLESLFATASAGFAAAQGIRDTLLTARAQMLSSSWQRGALKAVHIRLGMLHVGLGILSYGAGTISAAISSYKHGNEWIDAVKRGNGIAASGAAIGMVGSSGLAVTQGYGLAQTFRSAVQVFQTARGKERALAWATSGTRLSSLFARLNLFGLAFTVFELAGTWLYNHYNLSERDKWLLSTPWSADPNTNQNLSLAAYEERLAALGDAVSLSPAKGSKGDRDLKKIILNISAWPRNVLLHNLGQGSSEFCRLSISAWRVQPPHASMFKRAPETWVRCSADIIGSMYILEEADHLQLCFVLPEAEKTQHGLLTRELVVMVRLENRQPDNTYRQNEYLLRLTPDSVFPVTPSEESPGDDPLWRPIRQPLTALDL
ncbi:MAG: toxin VasX [Pseudomonadota bacterium]|nr:toxin VasX [Pseudomonadota bacterium]